MTDTFTNGDALVTFLFGVILPTADVYSDIALSVKLLNKSCDEYGTTNPCSFTWVVERVEIQNLFGWIIWIPIIINLLFTIPHFLRVEKTWKQRLLTLPLLICQCWPQYRSLRVLYFAYVPKNIAKCLAEKLDLEQSVSNLEPFLEATPQVHITLVLLGLTDIWEADFLVLTSFSISIISAAFGIAKLLKNGPVKIVRKDGKIGGYGTPGFILLMAVVACNMIGKAMWMAWEFGYRPGKNVYVWMWALTCILPQLLLTLIIWLINFGVMTTCQFIKLYPGYFLLGIFSPFMVSGEVHNEGIMKTMTISTKWTWINFILSIIGSASGHYASAVNTGTLQHGYIHLGSFEDVVLISFLPTFVPAAICLVILFCSKKLCSSCCNIKLPIVYKTGVDVDINDFSHIIDLQTGLDYGTNEDEETESNAQQLLPIASADVEIGLISESQQMQIDTPNEQVETHSV